MNCVNSLDNGRNHSSSSCKAKFSTRRTCAVIPRNGSHPSEMPCVVVNGLLCSCPLSRLHVDVAEGRPQPCPIFRSPVPRTELYLSRIYQNAKVAFGLPRQTTRPPTFRLLDGFFPKDLSSTVSVHYSKQLCPICLWCSNGGSVERARSSGCQVRYLAEKPICNEAAPKQIVSLSIIGGVPMGI